MTLEQMDVKTAFLHGDLEEQIYIEQPEGFSQPGQEHLVCKLKKSLYELKQSLRQWYKRFDSYMIKIGYMRCEYDCCVYVNSLDDGSFIFLLLYVDDMLIAAKSIVEVNKLKVLLSKEFDMRCEYDCCVYVNSLDDGSFIFLLLYVDDMLIATKSIVEVNKLKVLLSKEFDMKDLGAAKKILGMEIRRDRDAKKLWLSQVCYVKKVLERFSMENAKPVSTPLTNHFRLSISQCPKTVEEIEDMSKVPYASAVGCLMYVMVCTRLDLAHTVSVVSKYMANSGKQHWNAVKWIFRYLKSTTDYSITFVRQKSDLLVVGYVDADYAGDLDDRRSTMGYVFTLARRPICWKFMIQSTVAMSTTEAEYMAMAEASKEALWLKGLVKELGIQQVGVPLYCDSQSAIYLAKNQVYHARTKHIDVRFHKIRELVATGELLIEKIHTSENAADMLTKPITADKFKHCLDLINVFRC
jgi:hypothetical protein